MPALPPSAAEDPVSAGWPEQLLLACALSVLIAAVLRAEPLQSANDRSRWCTVWSLVERGTWQIDEIDQVRRFSTIDKVRHRTSDQEPWHFYSSKPPLLSTMVAGLYWVQRQTIGLGLFAHTAVVTRLLLLPINLLPMGLALLSLRRTLVLLRASPTSRLFVLATAGFGSMANPWLTTLNNHTPAVVCAVFFLSALIRILTAESAMMPARPRDFALMGFFSALCSCFELPAALLGAIAFILAARRNLRLTLRWFLPAAALPLTAFFVTNWICTGGLKPFYAYYGTDKYIYVHEGIPSYWSQPRGLDASRETLPVYLFHCTLGHHGILSLSPVLLLTLTGWLSLLRRPGASSDASSDASLTAPELRPEVLRPVLWLGVILTAATLGFYLSRTQNYNYGGNSAALRWMLWLSPFWWLALLPSIERIRLRRRFLSAALLLLVASSISAGWSQNRPWRPPWLFEVLQQAGWIDYSAPAQQRQQR